VRDYLVTRGIASDRISAQGFGPARSVGDNATPEGRANNRRVEIVVQPSTPAE
jgi:outer membrane protein OmpA-like peptidoglycan-associated protein